jgi:hypothetical protein
MIISPFLFIEKLSLIAEHTLSKVISSLNMNVRKSGEFKCFFVVTIKEEH